MVSGIKQRTLSINLSPARGEILDRKGRKLTSVYAEDRLVVFPALSHDDQRLSSLLSKITRESQDNLKRRLEDGAPFLLFPRNLQPLAGASSWLRENGVIRHRLRLRYSPGDMAAHLIGYVSPKDGHGIMGIESAFDDYLASDSAYKLLAYVDARNMLIPGLGYRIVAPSGQGGWNLVLTISCDIQEIVEHVADERLPRGAIVVMDPHTGEILAMTSRPTFDPNNPSAAFGKPGAPFVNRAVLPYPPGSIMKVLVAAAALQEGIVTCDEEFTDKGYVDVGGVRFKCYKADEGGHGRISFTDAMAESCNSVFIDVGQRLGRRKLIEYMEACGLGGITGLGIPEERPGSIPDLWHMSLQDLANASIGQGQVTATPLQVATLISAIANGGEVVRPKVVLEVRGNDGILLKSFPTVQKKKVFRPEVTALVRQMLRQTVLSGTGREAETICPSGAAGKTGTSETGKVIDGKPVTHAWFAGYVPADEPAMVIVVLSEEGGSGGGVAAPIFREIANKVISLVDTHTF